jgi:hypothetical protein
VNEWEMLDDGDVYEICVSCGRVYFSDGPICDSLTLCPTCQRAEEAEREGDPDPFGEMEPEA